MKKLDFKSLRKFNITMGIFHLVQGIIMLFIALNVDKVIAFKPHIWSYFLKFDINSMELVTNAKILFDLPFGILVSLFLFISALFHFIISSNKYNAVYNKQLDNHINQFRWYEYSLSSSLMIVLIAVLFGIYDIGALILIFGLNASMNLFGLLMEKMNQANKKIDWLAFIYGSIAGIIPWIVIIMYAFGNANPSEVPWFVYAIFISYLIFFNLFPINMILQYKKIGKWSNYLYGERTYIILSLIAKSILAWLVFFGVMQP
jgi:hypothetical protein